MSYIITPWLSAKMSTSEVERNSFESQPNPRRSHLSSISLLIREILHNINLMEDYNVAGASYYIQLGV